MVLNNLSYDRFFFSLGSTTTEYRLFAMPVDGTMNDNNANSVNCSIADVVIKSFDIYGSDYLFPI